MGYIGRISSIFIVWLGSFSWIFYAGAFVHDAQNYWAEQFIGCFMLLAFTVLGWQMGKKYDQVKFYSEKDDLTNTYNRRYFYRNAFPKMARKSRSKGQKLSLLLFDINDLKIINDQYGHLNGDKMILETALFLSSHTRKSDIVARWGGDEFVVLAPGTNSAGAAIMLDRVRNELNTMHTNLKLSAGYAVFPDEGTSLDDLIKKADKRMYTMKREMKPATKINADT